MFDVGAQHGREEPRTDDVVPLRTKIHRKEPIEEILVRQPAGRDLGRQRRGGPGIHDVRIYEASGGTSLVLAESVRNIGGWIDRQA